MFADLNPFNDLHYDGGGPKYGASRMDGLIFSQIGKDEVVRRCFAIPRAASAGGFGRLYEI
jgi:hypothetical protein